MIVFGIILFVFVVVILGLGILLYLSPILMGLGIIIIVNAASLIRRSKIAPILWDFATVAATIFVTGMFWEDMHSEAIDTGFLPFAILFIYGIGSFAAFGMPECKRQYRERKVYREVIDWEDFSHKKQKRMRINRVVAIVCTVIAVVGAAIIVGENANISETLPPTIIFAIGAMIFWAITLKNTIKSP